jgi:hypothetical protein
MKYETEINKKGEHSLNASQTKPATQDHRRGNLKSIKQKQERSQIVICTKQNITKRKNE